MCSSPQSIPQNLTRDNYKSVCFYFGTGGPEYKRENIKGQMHLAVLFNNI